MVVRRLAGALVALTLTLGTSACSLTGNVASLQQYAPSDGQQLDLEVVKARNFIYLIGDQGQGYLVGSLVNSSNEDRTVKLQYPNPTTGEIAETFYQVPANSKMDFGYNSNEPIALTLDGVAGQTALIYVLESETVNGSMEVPILDGSLPEYKMLLSSLENEN